MRDIPRNILILFLLALPCLVPARKLAPEVEYAMGRGAEAKICLKVCDDAGLPVSNASVRVKFDLLPIPHSVYGKTDANGEVVIKGKTNGNKISILVGKDGYYGSRKEITYVEMGKEHDVEKGKWLPYGNCIDMILRPIKKTVKLLSSQNVDYRRTDAIGEWIGYDIKLNDFVKPHGNGIISDFEVYLDWDGKFFPQCERIGMKIRFTELWSGYYMLPLVNESKFSTPYEAITNASFMQRASYYDQRDGKRVRNKFDCSKCWIIRSRCKTDSKGNLQEANYSFARNIGISGCDGGSAGFVFLGAFNPTPNDTNLEDSEVARQSRDFVRHCEPPLESNR